MRVEIAQALRCIGSCSASQLAKMVDRPADTLYQHLDALRCAGFVVEAGERREARHHERLFGAAADDFAMEFSDVFPSERHAAIKKTTRAFLGAINKSVDDSLNAGEFNLTEDHRNFILNYELS